MDKHILDSLFAVIASRQGADPATSYTAKLFSKGRGKIAQKVGEEGVETVIAALSQGKAELVGESADLLYHLMVLWAECGVAPDDVWAELQRREGISGIAEKNSRREQ
jgi:phosphoribosyl-ATP pyrophosphohydrolase